MIEQEFLSTHRHEDIKYELDLSMNIEDLEESKESIGNESGLDENLE